MQAYIACLLGKGIPRGLSTWVEDLVNETWSRILHLSDAVPPPCAYAVLVACSEAGVIARGM
jgi:hypothetical protein